MGLLDGATTLTSKITTTLDSSGPVQELKGIASSVASGVSGLVNTAQSALGSITGIEKSLVGGINSFFSGLEKSLPDLTKVVKFPLPNLLSQYASQDYLLSLCILSPDQYNNPLSYLKHGEQPLVIARTAGSNSPYNHISTIYGDMEFFIDELDVAMSAAGMGANFISSVATFKIIEPYSMGNLFLALQGATSQLYGPSVSWRAANYIIKVEFRGYSENGLPVLVPGSTRWLPMSISDIAWSTDSGGSIYSVSANASSDFAVAKTANTTVNETVISGKTVQEVLQSGENSLQNLLNKIEKDIAQKNNLKVPEYQYVIRFPTKVTLATENQKGRSTTSNTPNQATVKTTSATPNSTAATETFYKNSSVIKISQNLGLQISNNELIQSGGDVNIIGKSPMDNDDHKSGDPVMGKDALVYDKDKNIHIRSKLDTNAKASTYKFAKDSLVTDIINEIILLSAYATAAMAPDALNDKGQRRWWTIEKDVYTVTGDDNSDKTGKLPKLIVYSIVPKLVHVGDSLAPGTQPPGIDNLKKTIVKQYDYLYTGKNSEIIKLDIEFKNSTYELLPPDNHSNTGDAQRQPESSKTGTTTTPNPDLRKKGSSKLPPTANNKIADYKGTKELIKKADGGGGLETVDQKIARQFHNLINTSSNSFQIIDMEIVGDPFYLTNSGTSNYHAMMGNLENINLDGQIDLTNSEFYLNINFRNPVDINQATGLYDFGNKVKGIQLSGWSGVFTVKVLTHRFSGGAFTQLLTCSRIPGQEMVITGPTLSTLQNGNPAQLPVQPTGYNLPDGESVPS